MNAESWQVIFNKDFLQLLVSKTPAIIVANSRSEYNVGMYPRITKADLSSHIISYRVILLYRKLHQNIILGIKKTPKP